MKKALLILLNLVSLHSFAATDWSHPPVDCVEDIVPKIPDEPCLDLTQVNEPIRDFPANFNDNDIADWRRKKKTLTFCRYQEIARRENIKPGSQDPNYMKVWWMIQSAMAGRDQKIAAVYKASRDLQLPYTILAGAIRQESLFGSLGISPDGNNYSCGIGQFNIVGWCLWVQSQSVATQQQLGWPQVMNCSALRPDMMKPFYDIAVTKLGNTPVYQMGWQQFKDITYAQIKPSLGAGTDQTLNVKYQAGMSFAKNCINPLYGIQAKANEIARLYREQIPTGMKQVQLYKSNESWPVQCREKGYEGAYPFQIGWLMAVAMYNAGPRVLNPLSYYWSWNSASVKNPATFAKITPAELVEGLYWGGQYDKNSDEVVFKTLDGDTSRVGWYKMCVVQRHIARVVQHATQGGYDPLVDTLEGAYTCAPATTDPKTGQLISSAPPARKISSGVKAP